MLPVIWSVFALCAVGGFLMLAAYWLDVQDRPDLTFRGRVAWSAGTFIFPVTIPIYAFAGGADWPAFLRAAAFLPATALALFFLFLFGLIT
jgi:hypothetical protein